MDNNQLALDFARDVMGWDIPKDKEHSFTTGGYPFSLFDAVRVWLEEKSYGIYIQYEAWEPIWVVEIKDIVVDDITELGETVILSEVVDDDLPTALMTAVLEAERRRRDGTN